MSTARLGFLCRKHPTVFRNANWSILGTRSQSSAADTKHNGRRTPLYDLHVSNKGKMVSFAGFLLPVQYGDEGIAASHRHTRAHCSLFDVSHMLQTEVYGNDREYFFERLCTADITGLAENTGCLSLFTSETGGILDDLIVSKTSEGYLYVVSNAGRREEDQSMMVQAQKYCLSQNKDVTIEFLQPEDRALVALQGPQASSVLQPLVNIDLSKLFFMKTSLATVAGISNCRVTRCGYTGEDGFELSVPGRASVAVVEDILRSSVAPVRLAGLGARDSLRLEAGLCLYGNDIDESTTPVSAALAWTIAKRRRETKGFPGADIMLNELKQKPTTRRIGLKSEKRGPPARTGAEIVLGNDVVGHVTSGCPSPSLGYNISMGYVQSAFCQAGTKLQVKVRDTLVEAVVCKMPFVPAKYYTGSNK